MERSKLYKLAIESMVGRQLYDAEFEALAMLFNEYATEEFCETHKEVKADA